MTPVSNDHTFGLPALSYVSVIHDKFPGCVNKCVYFWAFKNSVTKQKSAFSFN